ncbi:MAG: hypothetical protein IIV97_01745, partial [Oscillospiraceae bacterium]|nr:hypothetical protein [Oscillospiraceae bacterium]
MQITRLALENWRNYKYAEIEFSETQNLLFGKNAQGKTPQYLPAHISPTDVLCRKRKVDSVNTFFDAILRFLVQI